MSENVKGGCLIAFLWLGTIALIIGMGVLTWNWIEPDSFGSGVLWFIVWGISISVGRIILGGIVALLAGGE